MDGPPQQPQADDDGRETGVAFHYLGGFQQGLRRGGIMAERAEEERRDPAADAVAVAVYSVLVLLLMLAWTYVPA